MGGIIGGVLGIGSALFGSSSSKDATNAQVQAAAQADATQRYMYDTTRSDQAPWRNMGVAALGTLAAKLGLTSLGQAPIAPNRESYRIAGTGKPTPDANGFYPAGTQWDEWGNPIGGTGPAQYDDARYNADLAKYNEQLKAYNQQVKDSGGPGDFKQSPGYLFRLAQGTGAANAQAAATGMLMSGAQQRALTEYGQNFATNDYDAFLNRFYQSLTPYQSLAGLGQTATQATSQAGMNYANQSGANSLYAGNARASGYMQQNAVFQQGLGNLYNIASGWSGGSSTPFWSNWDGSYNMGGSNYMGPSLNNPINWG